MQETADTYRCNSINSDSSWRPFNGHGFS